jgi:hypothetical protein
MQKLFQNQLRRPLYTNIIGYNLPTEPVSRFPHGVYSSSPTQDMGELRRSKRDLSGALYL